MNIQRWPRFLIPAALPLALGLLFFAASLTPSLIPRSWVFQGLLAGLVLSIGYMLGRAAQTLWRAVELPEPKGKWLTIGQVLVLLPALFVLTHNLFRTTDWQNSVRERVDMEPVESTTVVGIVLLSLAVFVVFFLVGSGIRKLFDFLCRRLYRYMAPRAAGVLGLTILIGFAFVASRDWVLPKLLRILDDTYETAQDLFDDAPPAPEDVNIPGGPGSLISWKAMGQPGRNFITQAPTANEIAAITGRPAKDPIRVYVGRSEVGDPADRAKIALEEMKRLGGFDRKVLLVTSPTGTGWLDPGSHDTLEFMHGGDVATVVVQYSYLQSPLALIFETQTGLEQATATMRTFYEHWRSLPENTRPQLYMHGLSLGAWSSMYSFDVFQMLNNPISGALWSGPPFPSYLWNRAVDARNQGTPFVLPQIEDGELIRFASRFVPPQAQGTSWGRMRILFMQHASDAIVFFDPNSFWRAPEWMQEELGPDVSPELRFMPVVTQWQLALDMILATEPPLGYGHNYSAREYVDGWVAVSNPPDWTPEKSEALKTLCENVPGFGCSRSASAGLGAK